MSKTKDRLQLRDEDLAKRIDAAIVRAKSSGIKINRSDILRAATLEMLERLDAGGSFEIKIPSAAKKNR